MVMAFFIRKYRLTGHFLYTITFCLFVISTVKIISKRSILLTHEQLSRNVLNMVQNDKAVFPYIFVAIDASPYFKAHMVGHFPSQWQKCPTAIRIAPTGLWKNGNVFQLKIVFRFPVPIQKWPVKYSYF